jgi:hypothetical protein
MRIRLKAGFDISSYSAANQVILTAMKKYGMILADNGGYFYFQGAPDPRWNDSDLENLDAIQSSNFEVVQMTPTYPGYDENTVPTGPPPTIQSFTASATSVAAGTPVTFKWTTSNDSYDFIDNAGPGRNGTLTFTPTVTSTYTLYSTNYYGVSTQGPLTVTVTPGVGGGGGGGTTVAGSNLASVRVYPNPWRKDLHAGHPITFDQMAAGSDVKIFTISGHKVKELDGSSGTATWDLTNNNGDQVASGIYIYLIKDGQGNNSHGKLAIIQ